MIDEQEAKTNLSKLSERVMKGERIVISRDGHPVAIMSPLQGPAGKRLLGKDSGRVAVHEDFDEPLVDLTG
ncbi:MAG TPA: type II toxin-antitoxin system prevent-host-death family antitoxin [Dehalococcoidia bacterium]|nr:type II toxin-antitoxin system prevent-host-death family antitoxin [Dehalococcoidia bacterium]